MEENSSKESLIESRKEDSKEESELREARNVEVMLGGTQYYKFNKAKNQQALESESSQLQLGPGSGRRTRSPPPGCSDMYIQRSKRLITLARNRTIIIIALEVLILVGVLVALILESWFHCDGSKENWMFGLIRSDDQLPKGELRHSQKPCDWLITFKSNHCGGKDCTGIAQNISISGVIVFIGIMIGLLAHLYSLLHLFNSLCGNKIRILNVRWIIKVTFFIYLIAFTYWMILAFATSLSVSLSFVKFFESLSASAYMMWACVLVHLFSIFYYYKCLNDYEKVKFIDMLLNEDEPDQRTTSLSKLNNLFSY